MQVRWAVIPVAGRGTRMLPLSRAVPKELLPLGRKPVLHHVIDELVTAGIRDLVFVVARDKPTIREYLSDRTFWRQQLENLTSDEVRMHFVEQERQLGLGDAVRQASSIVGNHAFVVALGDCVFEPGIGSALITRMVEAADPIDGAVIALETVPREDVSKYGIAKTETVGNELRILDLIEKPSLDAAPSRLAVAGRYVLSPAIFDFLHQTEPGRGGEIQLTDAIGAMIRNRKKVIGVPLQAAETRYDVGEFDLYFRAFEDYAAAEKRCGELPKSRQQSVVGRAFARAGLLGNPSDGYGGKTISCILRNWSAEVRLTPARKLSFVPGAGEPYEFNSVAEFMQHSRRHGYYGGLRLIQATTKRFFEFCKQRLTEQQQSQNFRAEYRSNIPRQLGLGGSSAIIIAMLRALAAFYAIEIPREWLPSLALSVETDELGIPAGLQDRVIQSFDGLMYMDFTAEKSIRGHGMTRGIYERLDHRLLPNLYVAFRESSAEPTEVLHSDLRKRFELGEPNVKAAMQQFAELARLGRQALLDQDSDRFSELMNANFDLRRSICRIVPEHLQMIDLARSTGASAKFCGSGGAIIGIYKDARALDRLSAAFAEIGAEVVRPQIDLVS